MPFDLIAMDDATVFPAARPTFLNTWIAAPGHIGRALIRGRRLIGWGVIRPCRIGRKIGPLIADDRDAAEAVFAALVRTLFSVAACAQTYGAPYCRGKAPPVVVSET
jgi:hypothetical protein